jgi:hypothetical protein
MRRTMLLVIVLVGLIAAACGTSDGTATSTDGSDTTTPAADGGAIEGPAAPDFTLTLGTGSDSFTLSDEAKPVYMVFWAEW